MQALGSGRVLWALVTASVGMAATSAHGARSSVTVGQPVPATFAEAQVVDADSLARPLADAWRDRPAILIFLRHFG